MLVFDGPVAGGQSVMWSVLVPELHAGDFTPPVVVRFVANHLSNQGIYGLHRFAVQVTPLSLLLAALFLILSLYILHPLLVPNMGVTHLHRHLRTELNSLHDLEPIVE
jgi:hypothetical protein